MLNQQGDVIAILDSSGEVAVRYTYDAWGNATVTYGSDTNYAKYNALTYRGYYYDADLELYYLGSRYYDAVIGRFINADSVDVLGVQVDLYDKNLYAYCDNNPIVRVDTEGDLWTAIVLGAVVNVASNFIAAKVTGQEFGWKEGVVAAVSGGLCGIENNGIYMGALLSGICTGIMSYESGASFEEALVLGAISAAAVTKALVGNNSQRTTVKQNKTVKVNKGVITNKTVRTNRIVKPSVSGKKLNLFGKIKAQLY